MTIGPVEYIIVGFPGNKFTGQIAPELEALVESAAAALEPNSSAALLIWEDLWATPFAEAVRRSDGVLLEGARMPHELIAPILADLPPAVRATYTRRAH